MSNSNYTADYFKKLLNMKPHIEGGYYNESFSSEDKIIIPCQNEKKHERVQWTSIYFLLEKNYVSNFHRLKSDEMWYFHAGNSLTIYIIAPDGELIIKNLGLDIDNGDEPQVLVPKDHVFGSAMNCEGFALVGCMVSPGFDFQDFEIFKRDELVKEYPQHEEIITRLTRD
ncbi:cupin [Brachionus plicatilis]|uniref:Cupin n=1 Tax=Brachionus plicatilis TaxID=10195 RepID=A0A3M7Q4T6_BRAPC|nr:cupin [Brachionus plicatilis]